MKKLLSCLIAGLIAAAVLTLPAAAVNADEGEPAADSSPPAGFAEEPVVSVQVPVDLDFTIDPFELAGRGQIYSDRVEFVNYGDTDVTLTITDASVIFANETDFEAVAVPFGEEFVSNKKAICLMLDFYSPQYPPVSITGGHSLPITIELGASGGGKESSRALTVTGSANLYPDKDWRDGDVKIRLTYLIEPIIADLDGEEIFDDLSEEEEPITPEEKEALPPEEAPARPPTQGETQAPNNGAQSEPEQNTSESAIRLPKEIPAS
jgi:hypothetical protein